MTAETSNTIQKGTLGTTLWSPNLPVGRPVLARIQTTLNQKAFAEVDRAAQLHILKEQKEPF
jgi:hypothetical protein